MNKFKNYVIPMMFLVVAGLLLFNAIDIGLLRAANPVANTSGEPVAIVGTRTGTTTTPVNFYTYATTTYPVSIGANTDTVSLLFNMATASSSGANAIFSLYGSNDWDCNTATTTTIYNLPIKSEITWYDIGSHIINATGLTSLPTATTTFALASNVPARRQITLTNMNSKCLAVEINASSTTLYVEMMTKGKGY